MERGRALQSPPKERGTGKRRKDFESGGYKEEKSSLKD